VSDRRLRTLERRYVESGSPEVAVRYAAALMGVGDRAAARNLLHPLTKKCPGARPLFVSLLPNTTSCAFCHQCGDPLRLDDEGYPTNKKGARNEKRSRCLSCVTASGPFFGPNPRINAVKPKYCGRCGIVLREPAHRCDRKLPDWISGGGVPEPRRTLNGHWSNWRAFS
jgi:hypothetical protein